MKILNNIHQLVKHDREATAKATVIACMNHKGGCGKTSILDALAHILMRRGYRVLIIDNDPQCNMTQRLGILTNEETRDIRADTLYNSLIGEDYLEQAKKLPINVAYPDEIRCGGTMGIIAGSPHSEIYAATAMSLKGYGDVRGKLMEIIEFYKQYFDYILIDTAPSIHDNAINKLVVNVADKIIVPFDASEAVLGLDMFLKWMSTSQVDTDHSPLFVLSKYQADTKDIQRAEKEQEVAYEGENRSSVYRAMKKLMGRHVCTNGIQERRIYRSHTFEGLNSQQRKQYVLVCDEILHKLEYTHGNSLRYWMREGVGDKLIELMESIERSRRRGKPIRISKFQFRN